jgi:hypothetical protein
MNAVEAKHYGLIDEVLGDTSDLVSITREGQIVMANQALLTNGAH